MRSQNARNVVIGFAAAVCLLSCAAGALGTDRLVTFRGPEATLRSFASSFYLMCTLPADKTGQEQLAMADSYGYVIIVGSTGTGFKRIWKSFHLGGMVKGLFIHDLAQDGGLELIVHTSDRIFVFDARTHELMWESVESDFTDISTLAIGQFDESDSQHEMLILAGGSLVIYDGVNYNREWESTQPYTAQEMVVGDVDGDGEEEVVMNTGFVFGALSHSVEWQTEDFGTRLGLIDIDDDGILEVIGESTGGKLRVFDIDKRQEKQDL